MCKILATLPSASKYAKKKKVTVHDKSKVIVYIFFILHLKIFWGYLSIS